MAFLLGFLVNCAFERWWEGATKIVQAMTEFRNAAAHFASATKRDTPETQELYETITRLMVRAASSLAAQACSWDAPRCVDTQLTVPSPCRSCASRT